MANKRSVKTRCLVLMQRCEPAFNLSNVLEASLQQVQQHRTGSIFRPAVVALFGVS